MKTIATWLMAAFISIVIIAGMFGPYIISVILMLLSALCVAVVGRSRRHVRPDSHKPVV